MDDNEFVRFDFVISELHIAPSRSFISSGKSVHKSDIAEISTHEVKELPHFLKRMLKKGGYCLIFIPRSMHQELYERCFRCRYNVISSLYTIFRDEHTVPRRNGCGHLPQSITEFAVVAKERCYHLS